MVSVVAEEEEEVIIMNSIVILDLEKGPGFSARECEGGNCNFREKKPNWTFSGANSPRLKV